jgi:hypothetical protein
MYFYISMIISCFFNKPSALQYYCALNELYEIRSKSISTVFVWDEDSDDAYCTFISQLHLRLLRTSFALRTYNTNLLVRDFTILAVGAAILWLIFTLILGLLLTHISGYFPIFGSSLLLLIFGSYVFNKKTGVYWPDELPARFLPSSR